MSFRRRLSLFFIFIVVIPMVAVAAVLFRLIDDSESGKADTRVAAEQQVAINLFVAERREARSKLDEIGRDRVLGRALQARDHRRAEKRARQLVRSRGVQRILIRQGGRTIVDAGNDEAIAPAARDLRSESGRSFGRLQVSVLDAKLYAERVRMLTEASVVVTRGQQTVLATTDGPGGELPYPRSGTVRRDGEDYRVVSFEAAGFTPAGVRVSTLRPEDDLSDDAGGSRITAGLLLLGFFAIAIILALYVSRSLQEQIGTFLTVARRLGEGDFSVAVPTTGDDEFAELGHEFNKMSRQLDARLGELRKERERVQGSMRRLGEAVASNLDRDALLEIVVRTAVEGVGADAGRASVCGEDRTTLQERSRVGAVDGLRAALDTVEIDALRSGAATETTLDDASAIAHPLRGADAGDHVVGVVSVGRRGRPFTQSERELFDYLAAQAAVSMENVDLHETVARESVTDDLTGLSNRRGFDETLTREVERCRRFGDDLGLVLFDLDDFKTVNDSHGHQQGDVVLREIARVLRETLREIDEPARYGGEELAVILPGTDLEGAFNLAERVRRRVERLGVPLPVDRGVVRLTTSAGVASLPGSARTEEELIAAADAALYQAKRQGKNRSVRA